MDKQQRAEDYSKLKVDESKLLTREVYSWSAKDSEKQYFPVSASLAGTKFFESKVQQNLVDSHSHWFRHQIANTWELGNVLLYWYETTQLFCRCSELLLKWAVHRTIKYDLWLVKSGPETNWCSHMLINCSPVLCLCCLLRLFPKPLPELMSV